MIPENPSPTVMPYLLYEDATAALAWLKEAFGLAERSRHTDAAGAVNHAEVGVGAGPVMLGSPGGADPIFVPPGRHFGDIIRTASP